MNNIEDLRLKIHVFCLKIHVFCFEYAQLYCMGYSGSGTEYSPYGQENSYLEALEPYEMGRQDESCGAAMDVSNLHDLILEEIFKLEKDISFRNEREHNFVWNEIEKNLSLYEKEIERSLIRNNK